VPTSTPEVPKVCWMNLQKNELCQVLVVADRAAAIRYSFRRCPSKGIRKVDMLLRGCRHHLPPSCRNCPDHKTTPQKYRKRPPLSYPAKTEIAQHGLSVGVDEDIVLDYKQPRVQICQCEGATAQLEQIESNLALDCINNVVAHNSCTIRILTSGRM
jgi:hypothetical protein